MTVPEGQKVKSESMITVLICWTILLVPGIYRVYPINRSCVRPSIVSFPVCIQIGHFRQFPVIVYRRLCRMDSCWWFWGTLIIVRLQFRRGTINLTVLILGQIVDTHLPQDNSWWIKFKLYLSSVNIRLYALGIVLLGQVLFNVNLRRVGGGYI